MPKTLLVAVLLLPLLLLASHAAPSRAQTPAPVTMAGGAMPALATCGTVTRALGWIGQLRGVEPAQRASRGRVLRRTDSGAGESLGLCLLWAPARETAQAP